MKKTASGFTIVELLIVIVVIAILATISVIAFSGVQQRARNSQKIAAASQFYKLIQSYQATYGTSPFDRHTCLGEGYPDYDNDGSGDCYEVTTASRRYQTDAATMTRLKLVSPSLPQPNMTQVKHSSNGGIHVGIAIERSEKFLSGERFYNQMIYHLEGSNADCGTTGTLLTGTWPNFTPSTAKNSTTGGGMTYCFVHIADPS